MVATSWSSMWALGVPVKATISSGTEVVWVWPSRVTSMGVIWFPSTSPVDPSTNWAKTRVGRSPGGDVPR